MASYLRSQRFIVYGTLGCVLLFLFYEYTLRVSDSVIVPSLMQTFHVDATGIGLISSSYYFVYVAMQIPAGFLIDRFRWQRVFAIAIALVAIGSMLFGITQQLWLAVIARILMGIGSAFAFVTSVKLIINYLRPAKPAYWIGIIMTIATFGAVCGQAPWLWFITQLSGWRDAYLFAGIAGMVLLLATYTVSKPLSACTQRVLERVSFRAFITIFRSRDIWLLGLYVGFLSAPYTAFAGLWGVPFLNQGHGLSAASAAALISSTWIGGLFGGPLLGYLADYSQRPRLVLITTGIIDSVLMLILLLSHSQSFGVLLTLLMLIGLLSNANVIVFAEMAKRAAPHEKGLITGITNMFNMGMGPILQLSIGLLLASFGSVLIAGVAHYSLHAYQLSLICIPILLMLFSLTLSWVKFSTEP